MKYVVFDPPNEQAFGPYASKEEAEEAMIKMAQDGLWSDVLEGATHTGWLEDGSTDLVLIALQH